MFCTNCGHKNDDAQRFCVNCGQPMTQVPPQPQAYAQPTYSQPPNGKPAYAPMPKPYVPNRKRNIIIGISAGAAVIIAALLLIFLLPQNAVVGTWYGLSDSKVSLGNGGRGSLEQTGYPTLDFEYEITEQGPDYIIGNIIFKAKTENAREIITKFYYQKKDGKEMLVIQNQPLYRNDPKRDLGF